MKILPDETAGSVMYRLAQQSHQTVATICQELFDLSAAKAHSDLDRRLPTNHSHELAGILNLAQGNIQQLGLPAHLITSVWDHNTRKYEGAIRVCYLCLSENKYGRRYWRTHFAAACPVHGVELTCICSRCHSKLSYFGSTGGIITQFWLESWPTCPSCLRLAEPSAAAHPVLQMMSKKWHDALAGQRQYGYSARSFLNMSANLLTKFDSIDRYRQTAAMVAPQSIWASHTATALLVRAICSSKTSMASSYAALGLSFQPDQLANDIMV